METDFRYKIEAISELPGHDDRVWHLAWNPAKPLLASCSADKSVRLYHYTAQPTSPGIKFNHITTISTGHPKTVRSVAWAPSGTTLATASFDANIGIWEQEADEDGLDEGKANTGEWECTSLLEGHETECKCAAYSSSGTLLASCSRDKTVWIWEVHPDSDFECIAVLMEHSQDVKCVAWHPKEDILASASYDDTIKLYIDDPTDDWYCFSTLVGHKSTVWSLAWSPCGKYITSASDDRTVKVWKKVQGDESKWESVLELEGGERSVYSVSWCTGKPKEESGLGWIACAGGDGYIRVWELNESLSNGPPRYEMIARLSAAHGVSDVNTIAWCPRKGYEDILATTGDDGCTRVWRVSQVQP